MPNQDDDRLEKAREHWQENRPLEAGRLIFEGLPLEERALWASNILKLVIEKSGVRLPAIEQLLHIADHPAEWQTAHSCFSDLRGLTLKLERSWFPSSRNSTLLDHLYLAENVAKVVYNSTNPFDEFDEDSGWWIAACLKDLVDRWRDESFSDAAWLTLCNRNF